MPVVPEDLFLEALRELVRLDAAWVPPADVGALYVRPLLFSTDPSIRVKPAERCQFLIVTFPFRSVFLSSGGHAGYRALRPRFSGRDGRH